jgi:hypothetical protein
MSNQQTDDKLYFWNSFIRAVEAEPRYAESLRGYSGLAHPVVALGVDETRRRIVVVSGESDARYAAMAQSDIQAAMPSVKVVAARPIAVNLAEAAQALSTLMGKETINISEFQTLTEKSDDVQSQMINYLEEFGPKILSLNSASLNLMAVFQEIIQQLALLNIKQDDIDVIEPENEENEIQPLSSLALGLNSLSTFNPVEADRKLGVCPIPLYNLSEEEVEVFHSGKDVGHLREILKAHDILQYFFPSADHLALGLAEQSSLSTDNLVKQLLYAPEFGHPFGKSEIVSTEVNLDNLNHSLASIIDSLQERKFLIEGEAGLEITPDGDSIRATVRYKPRESFLSKLSNVISVKIDVNLKDFFK